MDKMKFGETAQDTLENDLNHSMNIKNEDVVFIES